MTQPTQSLLLGYSATTKHFPLLVFHTHSNYHNCARHTNLQNNCCTFCIRA